MRIRIGRPDINQYADRFDVPEATGRLGVVWFGVSGLLIDDGESAVVTDGFFTRPGLVQVGLRKVAPDTDRVVAGLLQAGLRGRGVDAVIPVHTHFDHALDSAVVAELTGGLLVGGESTANVGRGHALADDHIRVVRHGESMECGSFAVRFIESEHCPPDRFPGAITEPLTPPAKAKAYKCGEAWSLIVEHSSGRTALVQGSAGFARDALAGCRADVAYLGIGQLGVQDEDYITTYWAETVRAVGARRVVLIHWDDFFRPLDQPLRALPYAGDDLGVSMRVLTRLAEADGVPLHLPTLWRREDPWSGLA